LAEKTRRLARFALAASSLFVLSLAWNGLLHLVILRRANEAVLVDVNQFLLYPLPAGLVLKWFVGGVLEFTFYGAVVSLVWRPETKSPDV
jgi:hypothetical protein